LTILYIYYSCTNCFNPLKPSSGSSKKTANQPKSVDDFVPEETIDSTFLDETDKGEVKKTTAGRSDTSDDSDR
jgi:hypothetical protein